MCMCICMWRGERALSFDGRMRVVRWCNRELERVEVASFESGRESGGERGRERGREREREREKVKWVKSGDAVGSYMCLKLMSFERGKESGKARENTYTHVHMRTHTLTHSLTHTHTHTHTLSLSPSNPIYNWQKDCSLCANCGRSLFPSQRRRVSSRH